MGLLPNMCINHKLHTTSLLNPRVPVRDNQTALVLRPHQPSGLHLKSYLCALCMCVHTPAYLCVHCNHTGAQENQKGESEPMDWSYRGW